MTIVPAMRTSLSTGHVEFSALSATEWRVSDSRIPVGDAGSILGFVELVGDQQYRLLQLGHGHGIEWFSLSSLRDVAEHFLHANLELEG